MAGLAVASENFRVLSGEDLVQQFEAPILHRPPPYVSTFCRVCGSPVPVADPGHAFVEIPAGLLNGDPAAFPDKHIFSHLRAPWHTISDDLPRPTVEELYELRKAQGAVSD